MKLTGTRTRRLQITMSVTTIFSRSTGHRDRGLRLTWIGVSCAVRDLVAVLVERGALLLGRERLHVVL